MAFPWGRLPTLREFVDRAKAQGCREFTVVVNGPDGAETSRILVGPSRIPITLPKDDDEILAPTEVGGLERGLGISSTGFPSI